MYKPDIFIILKKSLIGLGREIMSTAQADTTRSLEQEEPFDLSKKSPGKELSFHSDGKSAKGSSCHEEEEAQGYGTERYSPGMYHSGYKPYLLPDLSGQSEHGMKDCQESYCDDEENILNQERETGKQNNGKMSRGDYMNNDAVPLSFSRFENNRFAQSLSDYLYFQHRNKGLKELLERKMEKQAVFLGL